MKKCLIWSSILTFVILAVYFSRRQNIDTLSLFGQFVSVKFGKNYESKAKKTAQAPQTSKVTLKEKRGRVPEKRESIGHDNTTNGSQVLQHYETHGSRSPIMPNNHGNVIINNQGDNSFSSKEQH